MKEVSSAKFTLHEILQTAASLVVDDGIHSEALTLGQPEYANGNAQRRRAGNRKRKRRPQSASTADGIESPTASNAPTYWRGQVEDDKEDKTSATNKQDTEERMRPSLQASFKRRKQPAIREPLAALEKEQKLYEMRNKPESSTEGNNVSRNSANLKNILKNSGGLSLSEILQQKNLSLDDLLKGKQNALQALQTTASSPQEKVNHAKYPSFKANYKQNTGNNKQSESSSEDIYNSKEKSKLTALHRLKLFGSSSRPSGIQVGLADHLTTRKREGGLYSSTSTSSTTTTTPKPSTTKIPLYKKILHQRPTLKPTFLLKNTAIMASNQPHRVVNSWDSKEQMEEETADMKEQEDEMQQMQEDDWKVVAPSMQIFSTKLPESTEATTWKWETTMAPTTTTTTSTTSSTTTTTAKPITEKVTNRDLTTSTRRMYTSTRGSGRTIYRYTTSTTTPATTSTTTSTTSTTTTTPLPMTTTSTTSTTTASSSTMNLTPKANLNLNTEDLRERIQETLLKNLIEKDDTFKKFSSGEENDRQEDNDDEDDLENFFEETIKPKTTKYFETSTITTRMKQYTPFTYSHTTSTTTPTTTASTTSTVNPNFIPDFDNVDDRTDLLELIEDRRSGNRLFKVLEQRNMTLEELIEHRKRGSSQLHLATIVETPSRFYPDKKVVLQDNMDIVTAFENFPHFNLLNLKSVKPDDIKTDSQGSSYFTSIIDIEPTDEVYKKRIGGQGIIGELDKGASNYISNRLDRKRHLRGSRRYTSLLPDRSEKSLGFFPSWKTLALASLGNSNNNNKDADNKRNPNRNPYYLQQPKMLLENNSNNDENDGDDDEDLYDIKENELTLMAHDEDANEDDYQAQNPIQAAVRLPEQTAEAIENEVARAHDLVDLELSGHGFKRRPQTPGALAHSHRHGSFYTNMPPGIKSAIVASATIVLTALVTFMVIFAVCRWKQRRHRMSNIMKSYNAMKSKLPTIATTATAAAVASTNSSTNPNSRRSSLREMQDLLGGSGLSVAATITTTSSGVPNTPIHHQHHNLTPSPQLTNSSQATTMLAGNCSKNINNFYSHQTNNSNSNNSSNNSNSSCGLRPLQRQSSLLFQRSFNQNHTNSSHNQLSNSNNDKPTNLSILSGCNLLDLKRNNKMNGSTTSLSFSLTSGHNISNSHINTMDANSPEVQEYLFDTLRNSY
ncbi:hypothetical protein CVS40_10427 [Lucilia cuprina]|nr:hypothetical protein CVS40_10427 [Lucilia cuprina]